METGANLMGNVQYFENESHGTKLIDQIEPEQRIGGPAGVHIKEQAEVHNEEQAKEYIEEQAEAHNEEQAEAHIEEQAEVHTLQIQINMHLFVFRQMPICFKINRTYWIGQIDAMY